MWHVALAFMCLACQLGGGVGGMCAPLELCIRVLGHLNMPERSGSLPMPPPL